MESDLAAIVTRLTSLNGSIAAKLTRVGQRGDSQRLRDDIREELEQAKALSKRSAAVLKGTAGAKDPRTKRLGKQLAEQITVTKNLSEERNTKEHAVSIAAQRLTTVGEHRMSEMMSRGEVQAFDLGALSDEAAHLEERTSRLRKVEQDVVELNGIMKDLASLVEEQDEKIGLLGANVSSAKVNIQEGSKQISKVRRSLLAHLTLY